MKINVIKDVHVWRNDDVHVREEDWLYQQPDLPKEKVGMYNFWNEKKRSAVSDKATISKLVLDYDDGAKRSVVEEQFQQYDYIIYNSTGNQCSEGIEKFRVILTLKDPVSAEDLKWWRDKTSFKTMFKGVDMSSFAIGRFFYRASKYDKDRAEVVISHHQGEPFDFYTLWPHHEVFAPFEELKAKLLSDRMKPRSEKRLDIFDAWVTKTYQSGTHYSDICAFCRRAYSCGLEEFEAEERFAGIYAGHSTWRPNFRKVYTTMR